jgi:hypothetical protein
LSGFTTGGLSSSAQFNILFPHLYTTAYKFSIDHSSAAADILFSRVGVRPTPLACHPLFGLLYQPQMIDDDDSGAFGRIRVFRGNGSTQKEPVPVPFCSPQNPI